MSESFPTGILKWLDPAKFKYHNLKGLKGYILEVDFDYLKELTELCKDYSLVLDKLEIKKEISHY